MQRHAAALLLFVLLAIAWSWPLAAHFSTHVPGAGAGDNLTFLWNLSWTRQALNTPGVPLFDTAAILYPFGANLTLHTHTVLHGLIGAVVPGAGLVATLNAIVLASLALNGFVAYLLAFDLTRRRGASIVAGVIFGGSPFVMAHLPGHFNLVAAYVLPLFVLTLRRALASAAPWRAVLAGLALGWCVYSDYYYGVYAVVFALVWMAFRHVRFAGVAPAGASPWRRRIAIALASAGALSLVMGLAVAATGGLELALAGRRVSIRQTFNFRSAAWLLGVTAALVYWRPLSRMDPLSGSRRRKDAAMLATMIVTALVVTAPLSVHAYRIVRDGGYVSQAYLWRSAPQGIDGIAPFAGNPRGLLTADLVSRAYVRLGLDSSEAVAWIGLVPLFLLWVAWRRRLDIEDWRMWTGAGLVFFVWSLGPYLRLMGVNVGAPLPAILLRYVPIVNNARIPGRAMVVVYLAVAMLAARAISGWPGPQRRRLTWLIGPAVVLDFLSVPLPVFAVTPSPVDTYLLTAPAGAVCELPVGVRDGFGEIGRFDHRALYHQTVHRHPIVGGFVARLPPTLKANYLALPIVGALIVSSSGRTIDNPQRASDARIACRELKRMGIRYVVVNADAAPSQVVEYVRAVIPLVRLVEDGNRTLYEVCR